MKDGPGEVLVSICMVTYNHEKWIGQAIEGVLAQTTSYSTELVIGEDCSTDRTREIIIGYASKYPGTIRCFFNEKNMGLSENFSRLLNRCNGKYIAICEGDDFWTDKKKLQKQVEFLEENPEVVITSHNYGRLNESTQTINNTVKYQKSFSYNKKKYLEEWVTQPLTCIFRNIFRDYTIFNKEYDSFCDVILFYELLKHGTGYFMNDNMAVFRIHNSALSSGLSQWDWYRNHIIMFDYLYSYNKEDRKLLKLSGEYCISLYIHGLKDSKNKKMDFHPLKEYYKRTDSILDRLFLVTIRIPYYFLKYKLPSVLKSIMKNGK